MRRPRGKKPPRYAEFLGRECVASVERELLMIATSVASMHSGRHRGDRLRYERGGMNVKTALKYLHVLRIWVHFCLARGIFRDRWKYAALDRRSWTLLAAHMCSYSNRPRGLCDTSLESYMRMCSHALIFMSGRSAASDWLHHEQRRLIQRVVDAHCLVVPECRTVRNTKSAWDDTLVDAGMHLLLRWDVYGQCNLRDAAWPAFARMALSFLSYTGWRPFCVTRDRVDAFCLRWCDHPVLPFRNCMLLWQEHVLTCVDVAALRTKFARSPRPVLDSAGVLHDREKLHGKLTYCADVAVCPAVAWLVWAIVCGAFGFAPVVRGAANEPVSTDCSLRADDLTCEMVDALVVSIFALQPSGVLPACSMQAVFCGARLGSPGRQVTTDRLSNTIHIVGVRLGLDPSKCSGISCRKTVGTALISHPQTTAYDTYCFLGHLDQRTTTVHYLDPRAATGDSAAILRGAPARQLPGSVLLAHRRNMQPDVAAARAAGAAAAKAARPLMSQRRHGAFLGGIERHNAYRTAFRTEMQRQYDEQAQLPRCGDTQQLLATFPFQRYDFDGWTQAQFVAWHVKVALGLLRPGAA